MTRKATKFVFVNGRALPVRPAGKRAKVRSANVREAGIARLGMK